MRNIESRRVDGNPWCKHDFLYRSCPYCEIENLDREIEELKTQFRKQQFQKWISVKDRLPNETGYVIAGSVNHQWSRQSYFDGWDFRVEPDRVIVGRVTHWMPLPPPPEVADQ